MTPSDRPASISREERVARAIVASFEAGSPDIAAGMRMDWQTWLPEARAAIAALSPDERLIEALERIELISTNHGGWFESGAWEWGQMMGDEARKALSTTKADQ